MVYLRLISAVILTAMLGACVTIRDPAIAGRAETAMVRFSTAPIAPPVVKGRP